MSRKPFTPAQKSNWQRARREKVEQLQSSLHQQLLSFDDAEAWQRFLGFQSRMHQYSPNNRLLISLQCPHAAIVHSYNRWAEVGHQVRKGEKGIAVFAPMLVKVRPQPGADPEIDPETGEPLKKMLFKIVHVFDGSQVEPPVVRPPAPELLEGQAPEGLWDAMVEFASQHGHTVDRGDCGEANGYTNHEEKHIRVRDDIDDAQAVKTLAHEVGHMLLHPEGYKTPGLRCRGVAEVEAESVAYIVTQAHGLDSAQYTFSYVSGWATSAATNGRTLEEVVQETANRVVDAADKILEHTTPPSLEWAKEITAQMAPTVNIDTDVTAAVPSIEDEHPTRHRAPPTI
ncbi:MAG: ssDNA-binding domain-containing protein [Propionibacteriaceae bacterium]|jgi:hypothetical protein|nr:ssDNA-binding domain-containing protein [Propionibacteriaceae bacterium]